MEAADVLPSRSIVDDVRSADRPVRASTASTMRALAW
jgi:hypothetical protein